MTRYHPSLGSFLGSIAYGASPAATAGVVLYLRGPESGNLLWIASLLMGLFALVLCLQAVFVHLNRLEMNERGIGVADPLTGSRWMRWEDVVDATLRERRNPVSRTDHLLILRSRSTMINYPLSILSRGAEEHVLAELRARTKLITIQDRPAV